MMFDAIIVGGGPGGGAAALSLCNSGLRVLVLERSNGPRIKPCGGLLAEGTEKYIRGNLEGLERNRVREVRYLNNYANAVENSAKRTGMMLVDRASFDHELIQQAVRQSGGGLELYEGASVDSVEECTDRIRVLLKNGQTLESRYLIAADGVACRIGRSLSVRRKAEVAPSFDVEIEVSEATYERHHNKLLFNFFVVPGGYGWIFPKEANRLSCGVLSWTQKSGLAAQLDQFLIRNFAGGEIRSRQQWGFPIPVWQPDGVLHTNRVAFIGDAAALVDPITGEGIRYAIISGNLAAQSIIDASGSDGQASTLASYTEKVGDLLAPQLNFKRKFLSLLFSQSPEHYYREISRKAEIYENWK